ncbi:MAG: hypothetical protein H0W74_07660 [Sphingosinicella sp.]|nr:hypothetical protein [Sphingosinicella sp.]
MAPQTNDWLAGIPEKTMIVKLKSFAYTSRARLDLADEDVREIHQTARHLNVLDGVTGLLRFDGPLPSDNRGFGGCD